MKDITITLGILLFIILALLAVYLKGYAAEFDKLDFLVRA